MGPVALLNHALSSGSPLLRDALVMRATNGAFYWRTLRSALLDDDAPNPAVRGPELVSALRAVRTHPDDDDDLRAVHRGAVLACRRWPVLEVDGPARRMLVELLLEAGERDRASRLLGPRSGRGPGARLVALDLDNPFVGSTRRADRWARSFAALFTAHGLEPVSIDAVHDDAPPSHPFDRLRCAAPPAVGITGPLVTVILAVRDPGPEFVTAVDSIIAQTYSNWELVVIDDGSGASGDSVLDGIVERDERIRLVRHAISAGPYVRRNEALSTVAGAYVTFHDGDDWAHPRRLERQLLPLLAPDPPIATVCASLRVTDRLEAVHGRGRSLRITESSIMVHRASTTHLIGFFDSVRRGADSGYRLRLATQGVVQLVDPEVPLSLVRYRPMTLSGTDLRDGWTHPARVAYADAHEHWLALELDEGRTPTIAFPAEHRAFPAHPYIVAGGRVDTAVDIVMVGDARASARTGMHERLHSVIESLEARQGVVAMIHAAEPGTGSDARRFSRVVREARACGLLIDTVAGDRVLTPVVVALSTVAALTLGTQVETPDAELLLVVDSTDPLDMLRGPAAERAMTQTFSGAQPTVRRVSLDELALVLAQ